MPVFNGRPVTPTQLVILKEMERDQKSPPKKRTKKGTKLDEFELPVIAAIFARSNMGQGFPPKKRVEDMKNYKDWRTKKPKPVPLSTAVIDFCQQFMESDEHEGYFMDEAEGWLKDLKKETCEAVAQDHPDIAELFWRDPGTYVDNKRFPNG